MGRVTPKASEKQKVSECSDTKDSRDNAENKIAVIPHEKGKEGKDRQKQRENQRQDEPTVALETIKKGEPKNQENEIDEEAATATVEAGTLASNDKEDVKDNGDNEDEDEVSEVWDIIRVIPTAEEKIECRYENCSKKAVAVWASDKAPDNKWSLCEKCQLEDFGGWPEGVEPVERSCESTNTSNESDPAATPILTSKNTKTFATVIGNDLSSKDIKQTPSLGCNVEGSPILLSSSPPVAASSSNQVEEGMEYTEESFDLSQIVPLEKLLGNPVKCHDEGCNLPACSIYTSSIDPKKWYYCIDCQERDFDGWPSSNDLPCDYLEPEHFQTIVTKCSKKRNPAMPRFSSHCVTPLPKPPYPSTGIASTSQEVTGGKKSTKFSAAALARHEKWQADAKKLGVNRIIVKKEEAKIVIFDTLYDAFCPMSINDMYTVSTVRIQSREWIGHFLESRIHHTVTISLF